MNGAHNHNLDKPFPGCLGRMVNLFDFGGGMAGNRLLTDKPHCDGSSQTRRNLSDVSRLNQFGDLMDNNMIVSDSAGNCSKNKSNGTRMKILIAQEMSKELNFRSNPPSVVAKLMGLDTLPQGQPDLAKQRGRSRSCPRSNSDFQLSFWHQDKAYWDLEMEHGFYQHLRPNEYKDVYEITQQPQKIRDESPRKARFVEQSNDEKMALVRQKFIEAKRLSTDEQLRQSPEFDDALEVLNSNKDLLLKFLQEPNSMFSQDLQHLRSIPSQPDTKRITVLKPCKMFDDSKISGLTKTTGKQTKKGTLVSDMIGPQKNHAGLSPPVGWKPSGNPVQQTQIVVLKPSPGKAQDIKAVVSRPTFAPRVFHNAELVEKNDNVEAQKSRVCAKEITRQMCENLSSHKKDGIPSVFSNGYVDVESSFHKSESDYAEGNLSDVEIISPSSRRSWDYVNRFGSPYSSTSSFSRASYSPESSVCREAKKRLFERWATMASGENQLEQRHNRRSSSTLGEMLALSDTTNKTILVVKDNTEDLEDSSFSVVSGSNKDDIDKSPRNLVRSKSVPIFSSVLGTDVDVLDEGDKADILQEASKGRNVKSSLKGRVSSLFFSRSRKSNKGKPAASQSKDESPPPGAPFQLSERADNGRTQYPNDLGYKECSSASGFASSGKVASPDISGKPCIMSAEVGLDLTNPLTCGNASESQDQPSPVSVLEIPFEEDEHTTMESPGNNNPEHGASLVHSKSNLIDKSPPIGSIARSLSFGDSCMDTATSYPLQTSLLRPVAEEEEQEWVSFVETLLSVAGLHSGIQSDMLMARWYSSESPLDPSLRDKFIDLYEEEALQEARRRQRRSTCKLVFDCVNAALVEVAGYGSETCQRAIPCTRCHKNVAEGGSFILVNQVWSQIKEWSSWEERYAADDCGDSDSVVVERVVRKEVVGKGWMEYLRLEMDNVVLGIEGELLEDLMRETLVEFTVKTW